MKRIITILLSLLMILSVAACKNSESQPEPPSTEGDSIESATVKSNACIDCHQIAKTEPQPVLNISKQSSRDVRNVL